MIENNNTIKKNIIRFIVAGFTASSIQTLLAPLFRIQMAIINSSYLAKQNVISKSYKGFIHCATQLIKAEGLLTLWRGNAGIAVHSFLFQGISFTIKEAVQQYFNLNKQKDGFLKYFSANFISGALSGQVALTIVFPFSYPRVMMARMKGLKDFYKDLCSYLIPTAIYRGLYFGIFDTIKYENDKTHNNWTTKTLLFSISSTLTAQILSSPFETVKIKYIKMNSDKKNISSYVDCLKNTYGSSIKQSMSFKFPFLFRTAVGSLTLTVYQILSSQVFKKTNQTLLN